MKQLVETIKDIFRIMFNYIQAQIVIAGLNGLIAAILFFMMGIDYAWLLGLIIACTSFIPYLGPVLGFIPAFILAWKTHHNGWVLLGVGMIWLVLQFLETFIIQPKVLGNKLKLNPLIVFLAILLGGLFFGLLGILLAVPVVAIMQAIYRRFFKEKQHER